MVWHARFVWRCARRRSVGCLCGGQRFGDVLQAVRRRAVHWGPAQDHLELRLAGRVTLPARYAGGTVLASRLASAIAELHNRIQASAPVALRCAVEVASVLIRYPVLDVIALQELNVCRT